MNNALCCYLKNSRAIATSVVAICLLTIIVVGVLTAIQVSMFYQKTTVIQNDLDTAVMQALQSLDSTRILLGVDQSIAQELQHVQLVNQAQTTLFNTFVLSCKQRFGESKCPKDTDDIRTTVVYENDLLKPTNTPIPGKTGVDIRAWYGCQTGTDKPELTPLRKDNNSQRRAVYCRPEQDEVFHIQLQMPMPARNWSRSGSGSTFLKVFHAEGRIVRNALKLSILLDNSLSMGFSATLNQGNVPVDRLGVLWDNAGVCFFACHEAVGMPILKAHETYPKFNVEQSDQTDKQAAYDPATFTNEADPITGARKLSDRNAAQLAPEDPGNPYYRTPNGVGDSFGTRPILCASGFSGKGISRGLTNDQIANGFPSESRPYDFTPHVQKIPRWTDANGLQTRGTRNLTYDVAVAPNGTFVSQGVESGNHYCKDPAFYIELMPASAIFIVEPNYITDWDNFADFINATKDGKLDLMNDRYNERVLRVVKTPGAPDTYQPVATSPAAQKPAYYNPAPGPEKVGIRMFERDVDLARAMAGAQGTLLIDYALVNVKRLQEYFMQRGFLTEVDLYTFQSHGTNASGARLKVIPVPSRVRDKLFEDPRHLDLAQPSSDFNEALKQFYDLVKARPINASTKHFALFISDGEFVGASRPFNFDASCKIFKDAKIPLSTMRFENSAFNLRGVAKMRQEDQRRGNAIETLSKMRCDRDPVWTAAQASEGNKGLDDFDPLDVPTFREKCGNTAAMESSIRISEWFNGESDRGYAYGSSRKNTIELMRTCATKGGGNLMNVSKMLKLKDGELVDPYTNQPTYGDPVREMYKDYVLSAMPELTSYKLNNGYRDTY